MDLKNDGDVCDDGAGELAAEANACWNCTLVESLGRSWRVDSERGAPGITLCEIAANCCGEMLVISGTRSGSVLEWICGRVAARTEQGDLPLVRRQESHQGRHETHPHTEEEVQGQANLRPSPPLTLRLRFRGHEGQKRPEDQAEEEEPAQEEALTQRIT